MRVCACMHACVCVCVGQSSSSEGFVASALRPGLHDISTGGSGVCPATGDTALPPPSWYTHNTHSTQTTYIEQRIHTAYTQYIHSAVEITCESLDLLPKTSLYKFYHILNSGRKIMNLFYFNSFTVFLEL